MKRFVLLFGLLSVCAGAADIPRKAPDLAIALPGGKVVKTSDYSGKVVVLAFILTT